MFRPHVVQHGPPPAGGPIMAPPVDPGVAGAGFANANRRFQATSSQVFFVDPTDMEIGWQTAGPDGSPVYLPAQLTVPARYNFRQGFIYRLKLSNIDDNPGLVLYPTIEVAPSTPATDAYLTHNPIPVQFTQEDFDQVKAGNFVTKVVYLPDPKFQELAIAGLYGAETIVSTRLEPGIDPILEADKRGTILLIVRVRGDRPGDADQRRGRHDSGLHGGGPGPVDDRSRRVLRGAERPVGHARDGQPAGPAGRWPRAGAAGRGVRDARAAGLAGRAGRRGRRAGPDHLAPRSRTARGRSRRSRCRPARSPRPSRPSSRPRPSRRSSRPRRSRPVELPPAIEELPIPDSPDPLP